MSTCNAFHAWNTRDQICIITKCQQFHIDAHVPATHVDHTGIFRLPGFCDVTADGETGIAELLSVLNVVAPGDWHVVHNPDHTHSRAVRGEAGRLREVSPLCNDAWCVCIRVMLHTSDVGSWEACLSSGSPAWYRLPGCFWYRRFWCRLSDRCQVS